MQNEINRAKNKESELESLFTKPTEEAVSSWLDNHPEATTTVQDKSITIDKLVIGTLGYVTPEMFGAKGDGITDDTGAIQKAIDYGISVKGKLKSSYLITSTIQNPNTNIIIEDINLICKCMTDASNNNETCIYSYGNNVIFRNINISGNYFYGIMIEGKNTSVSNCYITGQQTIETADEPVGTGSRPIIGILVKANDCTINNCSFENITNVANIARAITIGYKSENCTIKKCNIDGISAKEDGDAIHVAENAGDNTVIDSVSIKNVSKRAIKIQHNNVSIVNFKYDDSDAVKIPTSSVIDIMDKNIKIYNCDIITKSYTPIHVSYINSNVENLFISGCNMVCNNKYSYDGIVTIDGNGVSNINIFNCILRCNQDKQAIIRFNKKSTDININNNLIYSNLLFIESDSGVDYIKRCTVINNKISSNYMCHFKQDPNNVSDIIFTNNIWFEYTTLPPNERFRITVNSKCKNVISANNILPEGYSNYIQNG